MILQSLVDYYEILLDQGKLERPGWSQINVSFALNIGQNGELLDVIPLKIPAQRGKKEIMVTKVLNMPAHETRSSGISAFFLCDNSAYFLGIDNKGNPKRAKECFEASRALHLQFLSGSSSPVAQGICMYFEGWEPDGVGKCAVLEPFMDDILSGANLIFLVNGAFAHEDAEIRDIWQRQYENMSDDIIMQCLVSGQDEPVATLHPVVKGVKGSQPSGALLVSFNASAFESYARASGQNAPVGKYAAFAYGAALNYLISDRKHTLLIGDATIVYWAEGGETAYKDIFSAFMNGPDDDNHVTDIDLSRILRAMSAGEPVDWNNVELNPSNRFYILGLAPNAARIAVRFFMQNSFGAFATNIKAHYDRLKIVKPQWDKFQSLPMWKLLSETINQNSRDKSPQPQLAGDTIRSVLTGGLYPATLLNGVMLRIKAEREITRGRAAIIKAYLIRNVENQALKEVLTVELNEKSAYQPYLLGRLFSLLEQVQEAANPGINSTIRDKYFNSAGVTPAIIFPLLIKLSRSHLRKLDTGHRIFYERQISEIIGTFTNNFQQRLSLPEQGAFQLGYYHQTQKRYEKKNNGEDK